VDPVPDPLLLRKSDSAGNRTRDLNTGTNDTDNQEIDEEGRRHRIFVSLMKVKSEASLVAGHRGLTEL
jgi:hypothetical protein